MTIHNEINICIGGEAGQGLITLGELLSKSLVHSGFNIAVTQEYMSRIRGGHNTFTIRAGSGQILAPRESIDLLVALNKETVVIRQAVLHPGFALVDILQPCVSFNKVNTHKWYSDRCQPLPADYDPENWEAAMKKAMEWGERIPVGLLYRNSRPAFESHFSARRRNSGQLSASERQKLSEIVMNYF